uniref:ATP synthase F(0) complex subunit a n=1 Tax=Laticauda laticaudata TaxID=8630 RepID=A0A8C5RXD8_LATLA
SWPHSSGPPRSNTILMQPSVKLSLTPPPLELNQLILLKVRMLAFTNIFPSKCNFITSLLLFILISNLISLLPYTFATTSQLSINMALAVPLATVITGIIKKPSNTLAHLLSEGSPTPLIPFIILIETISLFIHPLALGVRLTANITAGHLLITIISSASFNLINTHITLSILSSTLLFILTLLELAVACIQAYVFVLLIILYLQENT